MTAINKDDIIGALYAFVAKRPMLEPRNYISDYRDVEGRKAYFSESRAITKDRHIAEDLLRAVSRKSGISADDIIEAAKRNFAGRLEITTNDKGAIVIDYCVGQYWPTEYRKAVSSVMRGALWTYWRDQCACDSYEKIKGAAKREFRNRAVVQSFN